MNVSGLGLLTGSGERDTLRLMAERRLKSSIHFSEKDDDLGILGLRSAPLNLMMNSKIPSSAPCGVNPGRYLLDGHELLNLINIDLFVRYELCLKFAKSGIKHEKLNGCQVFKCQLVSHSVEYFFSIHSLFYLLSKKPLA